MDSLSSVPKQVEKKEFEVMEITRHDNIILSILQNGNGIGSVCFEAKDYDLIPSVRDLIDEWNSKRKQQSGSDYHEPKTITGRNVQAGRGLL